MVVVVSRLSSAALTSPRYCAIFERINSLARQGVVVTWSATRRGGGDCYIHVHVDKERRESDSNSVSISFPKKKRYSELLFDLSRSLCCHQKGTAIVIHVDKERRESDSKNL